MIPLRRSLIVKEHRQPQVSRGHGVRARCSSSARRAASQAKTVFMGFGLGALYKLLNAGMHALAEVPKRDLPARARQRADASCSARSRRRSARS